MCSQNTLGGVEKKQDQHIFLDMWNFVKHGLNMQLLVKVQIVACESNDKECSFDSDYRCPICFCFVNTCMNISSGDLYQCHCFRIQPIQYIDKLHHCLLWFQCI